MAAAWPTMQHTFALGPGVDSTSTLRFPEGRPPQDLLRNHPVDLLISEHTTFQPQHAKGPPLHVLDVVSRAVLPPRLVIEIWDPAASTWDHGPLSKGIRTRWLAQRYRTFCKTLSATEVGGAIDQCRLLVVRQHTLDERDHGVWSWPATHPGDTPRSMSNLLTPDGLVPPHLFLRRPVQHTWDPAHDAMPWCPPRFGSLIRTPRGVRRLQPQELFTGLGLPSAPPHVLASGSTFLRHTTSLFHWEYLGSAFSPPAPASATRLSPLSSHLVPIPQPPPPSTTTSFTWHPPSLRAGGRWFRARLRSLWAAARTYGQRWVTIFNHGLTCLARHRLNYDHEGPNPSRLQLLWWEFPSEHWDALREGSSMNFMAPPPAGLTPNGEMDDEQRSVAGAFVDELIDLAVVKPLPKGGRLHASTPLFVVPKPGQPGQWRVIADMKRGGQNSTVCSEPVYLNRPLHILEQLHSGGWSAVVDASKFFYQFSTHPADHPYLGVIHPVTGEHFYWASLPMGAGNSPACAGRYGLAFLRLLRDHLVDPSITLVNTWGMKLQEQPFDPSLGHGFVLLAPDGSPAVRVWAHVDDFLIHGPTLEATTAALNLFMDLALQVGLLCHPKKLIPPTQTPKYTGFIFDTRSTPTLRVPTDKRERALAMVSHIRRLRRPVSALALSVVTGTLESLSDATPARIGHTYLRHLYDLIHPDGAPPGDGRYFGYVPLSPPATRDLAWWRTLLTRDLCRPARPTRAHVLVPTFGDGSGTGTGGTLQVGLSTTMWMSQWQPHVFHHSSNWKELKTLELTLTQLLHSHRNSVRGATVFYFTDNAVTYYVTSAGSSRSPGLHTLVESIKLTELTLGCTLQPIHVPGRLIIAQGTDALSRGIWASPLHHYCDRPALTAGIFSAAAPPLSLAHHFSARLTAHRLPASIWPSLLPPSPSALHSWTVYAPPPELARQAIIFFLELWVESPWDTGALFFVPRVLTASWHHVSRHLQEVATLSPDALPHPAGLPIPTVVLTVLPFCSSLPSSPPVDPRRSPTPDRHAHRRAADTLRRLPGTPVQPSY